ncbi:hypothetical protein D3C72_96890 [compost metagenome]
MSVSPRKLSVALSLCALLPLVACAPAPSTSDAPPASDGAIVVKGRISSPGAKRMLLVETKSNAVTPVDLQDGAFSASVPKGNYAIALLDGNNQPQGLLLQNAGTIFELTGDIDLGGLTWNAAANTLKTVSALQTVSALKTVSAYQIASDDEVDFRDMVSLNPEASGNRLQPIDLGKVFNSGTGDFDEDRVPDFLDNDNNANGVFDSLEGLDPSAIAFNGDAATRAELAKSRFVVFDNLKLQATELSQGDGDAKPHTDKHVLALHLHVPTPLAGQISGVALVGVPNFLDGSVVEKAGQYAFSEPYPARDTAWSASGYKLPLADQGGQKVYSIWIRPKTDPTSSVVTCRVSFKDGRTALVSTRLFYAFNTPPRILTVNGTAFALPQKAGDPGSETNPLSAGTGEDVTITADRPKTTAHGVPILGLGVQGQIFTFDAKGQINATPVLVPAVPERDMGAYPQLNPLELAIDRAKYFGSKFEEKDVERIKLDVTLVGPNGDNTAVQLWFKP